MTKGTIKSISVTLLLFGISGVAHASSTTKVESVLEIINQEYQTTNTTASPTDNSLGLVRWQSDKFNNESAYFEAVLYCSSCTGGNQAVVAELYSSSGSLVTSSAASTTSSSYTIIRSGNIASNLTNNTDYTVRVKVDATSGTAFVKQARIVVDQSGTAISDFLSEIEIGNNNTTANTSYELITDPKIYLYDQNAHSNVSSIYFESTLKGSDATATSYASLSSSSNCSSTVTGSEVSIIGTTWGRSRTSDISSNLVDDTEYWVCVKTTSADTGSISNAKLIIEQSDATTIQDIEIAIPQINYLKTDTDSTYTNKDGLFTYNASLYAADTINIYLEATIKASAGTAYTRLYDKTNTAAISNSEISTANTAYTRIRSSELRQSMPSSSSVLDIQLKNSGLNTTTASGGWLIIQLKQTPDPIFNFTIGSVAADTVSNEITTSVASTYNQLDFSNITFSEPKYIAHQLTVTSNASKGYAVTMELINFLQGNYPGNNIDPFPGSWGSPVVWTEPTGTSPNIDTAWIGANTSDSRVTGWTPADSPAQKFGPVNSAKNNVMYTNTTDDSGTSATVTYVIESNLYQPSDSYVGTILYSTIPIY